MKQRILLLVALTAAFASCSVYKNGQTPDDVYYSPGREMTGYVNVEDDPRENEGTSPDDRYLRMKSLNRNRWSQFDDDFAYWNNPMWNNQMFFNGFRNPNFSPFFNPWMGPGWNMGIGFNNGWGNNFGMGGWGNNFGMGGWGGFGNIWNPFFPGFYGTPIVMVNPKPINTRQYTPRGTNLGSYSNRGPVFTTDPKTGNRVYSVSGNGNSSSSFRSYRSSGGNYYVPSSGGSIRNSSGSPSRSFEGGSSPSFRSGGGGSNMGGGSGGGSGGSAPVRSFPRGGGQ